MKEMKLSRFVVVCNHDVEILREPIEEGSIVMSRDEVNDLMEELIESYFGHSAQEFLGTAGMQRKKEILDDCFGKEEQETHSS